MTEAFDRDVALRQAFGVGFQSTSRDSWLVSEIRGGRLHLPPHPVFELPETPTWIEDPFGQKNWNFQYHAMRWLDVLRREAKSGDKEAMVVWSHYMRSWAVSNPPGEAPSKWAWIDMADGLRAHTLVFGLPYLDDATWALDVLSQHGEWLADEKHIHHGNHAMTQHVGLFLIGRVMRNPTWSELAVVRLGQLFLEAYDDEGVNEEASPGYQVLNYNWWRVIQKRFSLENVASLPSQERLDKAPYFLSHATRPDGTLERIGDTDGGTVSSLRSSEAQYVTTGGAEGVPPLELAKTFCRGYVFGRSGWGETGRAMVDESYYSLRFGAQNAIHGHPDGGSITYSALGQNWLTDTGKYAYDSSLMRKYVLDRAGQNVITIAGRVYDRSTTVELVREHRDSEYDYYFLRDAGYEGIRISRLVCYSRRGEWILVFDRVGQVQTKDELEVTSHWHFDDTTVADYTGSNVALTVSDKRATMLFFGTKPDVEVLHGSNDPFGGWNATGWREKRAAPEVLLTKKGKSVRFGLILTPRELPHDFALRGVPTSEPGDVRLSVPGLAGDEKVIVGKTRVEADTVSRGAEAAINDETSWDPVMSDELLKEISGRVGGVSSPEAGLEILTELLAIPGAESSHGDYGRGALIDDLRASFDLNLEPPMIENRLSLPRWGNKTEILHRGDTVRVNRNGERRGEPVPTSSDQALLIRDAGALALPMFLQKRDSEVLCVVFHGALNRARTSTPRFERARAHEAFPASALFVADPTLDLAPDLTLGWYLGTATTDLPAIVAREVDGLATAMGASRIILLGSSGGGFAAMQVGARIAGSEVAVFSPQVDIRRYFERLSRQALELVFGEKYHTGVVPDDFNRRINVIDRMSYENKPFSLSYVQNINDGHHVSRHASLLSERSSELHHVDVNVEMVDWEAGHARVSNERYLKYLRSILESP